MRTLPRRIKLYRKLRYSKGHGVHSPFVYNLITKVIEEKSPYYAFDEIEKVRQQLLSGDDSLRIITINEIQHPNYGALLFRLVNFFKCQSVLQIGGSTGIMSLYLAMASRNSCRCIVLEERVNLMSFTRTIAKEKDLNNLVYIEGKYEEQLKEFFLSGQMADLIFINIHKDAVLAEKIFSTCIPSFRKNTILVLDGISGSRPMRDLWKRIKDYPQTSVTVDLHALGIVFFNDRLHKQHYQTYFDYGKKQNIHKNRRQRLYFSGWRRKGFQNTSEN